MRMYSLQCVLAAIGFVVGLSIVGFLIAWAAVFLYAEADCLQNGYPEYRVSVGLERYCITLDGTVSVTVDKQ